MKNSENPYEKKHNYHNRQKKLLQLSAPGSLFTSEKIVGDKDQQRIDHRMIPESGCEIQAEQRYESTAHPTAGAGNPCEPPDRTANAGDGHVSNIKQYRQGKNSKVFQFPGMCLLSGNLISLFYHTLSRITKGFTKTLGCVSIILYYGKHEDGESTYRGRSTENSRKLSENQTAG